MCRQTGDWLALTKSTNFDDFLPIICVLCTIRVSGCRKYFSRGINRWYHTKINILFPQLNLYSVGYKQFKMKNIEKLCLFSWNLLQIIHYVVIKIYYIIKNRLQGIQLFCAVLWFQPFLINEFQVNYFKASIFMFNKNTRLFTWSQTLHAMSD